ncbi:MAG: mannose-1-phosphate guanylyltransferase/mannose-6-phosphate isomerase [Casimicrobiaceae bacterium]
MKLVPVILSGGTGARLWPASREAEPKPFIVMPDGKSLLQKALLRAFALAQDVTVPEVLLVTNREYLFRTVDERIHLPSGTYPPLRFVLEPMGRNTAPAIALAARAARAVHGPDVVLLVLASDHLINDVDAFRSAAVAAATLAATGMLVTFGITPTRPDSGFGYIECGERIGEPARASGSASSTSPPSSYAVSRFVEKPTIAVAEQFLAAGNYVWNSGIFCYSARAIADALSQHAAELAHAVEALWPTHRSGVFDGYDTIEFDTEAFARLPNVSIDYAVMEKASNVACVRGTFDWSDIGSWSALSDTLPADADGNRQTGTAISIGSRNTAIHAGERLVAAIGVENLVIVDTPDAVLIAHRDRTQSVKDVVAELKRTGDERYRFHHTTARPWGSYTVLQEGIGFKIKRIEVKPGHTLSLQMHHRRSEHWVVVSGQAEVTCGDRVYPLAVNESTFIPVETKHRLANRVTEPLIMIEVQCGDYLGEDDIVRFEDRYGRAEKSNH